MRKLHSIISLLIFSLQSFAQNPVSPPGIYIADPSAHVWEDGKLYVYGSLDESTDYYCSHRHHVLSTDDMIHWTLHENVFASKGEGDEVSYSDSLLYAPDVWYRDGTYYMYYCLNNPKQTEGVAPSKNPEGPFVNGTPIDLHGKNQIDPAVFVDDDGQGYYIWGQFQAKMAKLKPNMKEIDESTITENVVTEDEHFFHEGGYLVKRNGIYYFVYAHMGRADRPTCIGYATSTSPMGPYTYGGVIVDNDHSDPEVWNNHGSIVEFKGQWYVFYHRSTHGNVMMRKACVEPIEFLADGSIPEVEMTSQGTGPPFEATKTIPAERACLLYGHVRIEAVSKDNEALRLTRKGDNMAYKYIDFGKGVQKVTFSVAPGKMAGKIDLSLDRRWRGSIATLEIPGGGDGTQWQTFTVDVKNASGVHALWLRIGSDEKEKIGREDLFNIDWFRFE